MDFLLKISIDIPSNVDASRIDVLKRAESARASELAQAGILIRLWRASGPWDNWGLWRATDSVELERQLASLPLYPYMNIQIHPLTDHPNDPGRGTTEGAGSTGEEKT